MKIFVICRQNHARSISIAALLRKHFPEISVQSAGVEVSQNAEIPLAIRTLCNSWELAITETVSTPWESLKNSVEPEDLLICADDHVFEIVKVGVKTSNVINLTEIKSPDFLVPIDPAGATRAIVEQELAKCLAQTIRLLSPYIKWVAPMITEIYVPSREESIQEAIERAFYEHSHLDTKNIIYLDCNLRAPNSSLWNQRGKVKNFEETLMVKNLQPGDILQASYEFTLWSQILLSLEWKNFVADLGKSFQVVALAPPLYVNNLISTESLFSLLCAEKHTLI
jgi:protein-tyrosine-phosphatase